MIDVMFLAAAAALLSVGIVPSLFRRIAAPGMAKQREMEQRVGGKALSPRAHEIVAGVLLSAAGVALLVIAIAGFVR